jgi:Bacterial PH domain
MIMNTAAGADDAASRAVFRVSPLMLLAAPALAVCVTPFAVAAPLLWVVYLVPLAIILWTVRVRTCVDADAVTVRRIIGRRRVPWSQISSLRLGSSDRRHRSRVHAVLVDGAELPLPAVHISDLPQLAAVSGGRLPDPAGE